MIATTEILNAKILIVDDAAANVLLMERLLAMAGYTSVHATSDPNEVCILHRKNLYDLIVLDLVMPGLDGFQVMEALKLIEPGTYLPVLVLSAQPGHKQRALEAGARQFLGKPFQFAEFAALVNHMLDQRLSHMQGINHIKVLE